jgi:hypothetical protein
MAIKRWFQRMTRRVASVILPGPSTEQLASVKVDHLDKIRLDWLDVVAKRPGGITIEVGVERQMKFDSARMAIDYAMRRRSRMNLAGGSGKTVNPEHSGT